MNCTEANELLALHVAGELRHEHFDAHLAVCESCARRAELHQRVWDLAGLAVEETPPPEAVARVTAEIGRRGRTFPFVKLASLAAAAVLVWLSVAPRRVEPPANLCAPADEIRSAYLEPAFGELSVEDAEASGPLGLRSHRVSVEIGDWAMRTEVEEIFTNVSDRRLEGTFQFPLPADASLSRFAMEVNGALVEGELIERVRAREVYEGIVRKMQDPALLEWMPGNIFKARVFPIEPRSEKRILLAYTQAPRMWNGAIRYVYPLVSEKMKACPPENLSVRVDLRFSREIKKLQCRADVSRPDARSARASLSFRNARPLEDFQLRAELEPDELEVASTRAPGEDGFVGVAFAPPAPAVASVPGTFVFVLDRSARMGDKELSIARRVVERMIDQSGESVRVGFVAHHIEAASIIPERATPERRKEWREFLSKLRGEGACDVAGAIRAAAALAPPDATIVYVGKGAATWGETDLAKAAPAVDGRSFRSVLIGTGANDGLSSLGPVQSVLPGGDVDSEIGAIARTVGVRPIEDVRLILEGVEMREAAPASVAAIFPGERIHFFARYAGGERPARGTAVVRGRANGLTYEKRIEIELAAAPTEHRALPRLWAQRALMARVAECQRRGEPRDLVDGIVAMSRQYQVMTPYTSFLVLESEDAYKQHQIERAKRREEEARKEEEQKKRLAETAAKPAPEKPVTFSSSKEMEKVVRELARGRSQEEQARIAESQQHYQIALTYHNRGEFEKAKIEAENAVVSWHENIAARKLLNDIQQIIVGGRAEFGPRTIAEDAAESFRVQIEQANIEITKHVRDGERYYNARMFDEARREFESAQFKIENIPYEVRGMQELLPRVRRSVELSRGAEGTEDRRGPPPRPPSGPEREKILKNPSPSPVAPTTTPSGTADEHYRLAERYFQAGDFEKAALESNKAIQLNGNHAPARALKMEMEFNLGRGRVTSSSGEYDNYLREALVRHQQTLVEIDSALAGGQRQYNAGDYGSAEREFRKIVEYAKWMPTGVELETRRKQALEMLGRTRDARFQENLDQEKQVLRLREGGFSSQESARLSEWIERVRNVQALEARRVEGEKKSIAESEAAAHEVGMKREIVRKMAQLLESSYRAYEQGRYDRCLRLCDDLLEIDPHYAVARELKEQSENARHKEAYYDTFSKKIVEWRRATDEDRMAIPLSQTVRYPSREEWGEIIAKRKPKGISELEEDVRDEDRTILDKLKSIRITIDMKDAPLSAIIDYIREITGLNFHISGVENADTGNFTLKAVDLPLQEALRQLLGPRQLAYFVRDGVVLVTTRGNADASARKLDEIRRKMREEQK